MSRLDPYLGIIAGLFFGILFAIIFGYTPYSQNELVNEQDTAPAIFVPPNVEQTTQTPAQSVEGEQKQDTSINADPAALIEETEKPMGALTVQTSAKSVPVATPTAPIPSESLSLDFSAATLRSALVNIFCRSTAGSGIRSISGSGVIIDQKGIILTNAHIAQYYLLSNRNVSCTIRSGSPARDSYKASLIYIPPTWINKNARTLTEQNPIGTGEHDFAFLAITKSATQEALPSSFSYIRLAKTPPEVGTSVVIGAYGAQFLESRQIQYHLFPIMVFGSVKNIFTFTSRTIDVMALGGSAAAQEGSSGGGVSDISGELIGTITTSTTNGATNMRQLNAITASYIRAAYASETGEALDLLLDRPVFYSISNFAPRMSELESILTAHLP